MIYVADCLGCGSTPKQGRSKASKLNFLIRFSKEFDKLSALCYTTLAQ